MSDIVMATSCAVEPKQLSNKKQEPGVDEMPKLILRFRFRTQTFWDHCLQ
jgi:hypothetical protein